MPSPTLNVSTMTTPQHAAIDTSVVVALVDRRDHWHPNAQARPEDFDRDIRCADTISERSSGLRGGWIAVAVGWAHSDPGGNGQPLCRLMSSNGFPVIPVCLRVKTGDA